MGSRTSPKDETVVLSGADAREIDRLLRLLQRSRNEVELPEPRSSGASAGPPLARTELREKARALLVERKRRAVFFSKAMFGEPAWDILLHLYASNAGYLTVGKIVSVIGEPKTTILRWIAYLDEKRLIEKRPHPKDQRLVCVELLDRGRNVLDDYFRSSSLRPARTAETNDREPLAEDEARLSDELQ